MTLCIVPNCQAPPPRGIARCDLHERRRIWSRNHARRKQAWKQSGREAGSDRCGYRLGRYECNALLRAVVTDRAIGRVTMTCDRCERRKAGICQECARPVYGTVGRTLRCAEHAAEANRRSIKASAELHIKARRASSRAYYQNDDDRRAHRNEYKRAWRKLNPDKVQAQKRRRALRQPKSVTKYNAKYRAKYRDYIRLEQQRARGQADDAQPVKVRRPKLAAERLADGARLCCVDGCESVMTGRAKKCDRCKARDRQWATSTLTMLRAA